MNWRMSTSLRLLGIAHKKKSTVIRMKRTICPAGKIPLLAGVLTVLLTLATGINGFPRYSMQASGLRVPDCRLLGRFNARQPRRFRFFGQKARADGVGGKLAQFITSKALFGVGQQVFVGQIGSEEGRIIRVERDRQSQVEAASQRVGGKRGADAGANVRRRAQLQRHCSCFQLLDKFFVLKNRYGMAEALRANGESFPDSLGAGSF